MKKLIIDLSYTQGNNKIVTGIYLYGKEALKSIVKAKRDDIEVSVSLLDGADIDEWILKDDNIKKVYLKEPKFSKEYWGELSNVIKKYDIAFFPYQIIEGKLKKYNPNTKIFMTIHDMTPLLECRVNKINKYEYLYKFGFKNKLKYYVKCVIRFSRIWYKKRASNLSNNVSLCDKVITVSEASKNDIASYFKIDRNNVINCYSKSGKETANKEINSKLEYKDYYLLVSAGRYLKNAHLALYALDEMWSNNEEHRPVLVLGNLSNSIMNKIKNKDKIVRFGYVSDDDLEYLYKNAYCFIFPSLSEGFGLPPLEAMKYGTKVACSTAMSLNELYPYSSQFDPYSIESIKKAIKNLPNITKEDMIKNYNEVIKKQELFDSLLTKTIFLD